MRVPQIQITSTNMKLDMQVNQPTQQIEQKPADLQIEQTAAILEITTTPGQLQFDASQFWSDLGFKRTDERVSEAADRARQSVLSFIERRATEGRRMLLEAGKGQGAKTIQSIMKGRHGPERAGPINIQFIPSYQSIKTSYEPSKVDIHVQPQKPNIDVHVNKPTHHYTAGNIEINVAQYNAIQFDWTV